MRINPGNGPAKQDNSGDNIPHYFQYHLENPGADVLMAALQPSPEIAAGSGPEWLEPGSAMPLENRDVIYEDPEDPA